MNKIMKKSDENRNALIAGVITAILLIWMIMSTGCTNYKVNQKLKEPGHWPGWIIEPNPPLYGPHDRQIELRNAYSDGWQDRGKARQYE